MCPINKKVPKRGAVGRKVSKNFLIDFYSEKILFLYFYKKNI